MSRSTWSPRRTLSQERLARDLGVDRGNLAGLERGMRNPTFYTIVRLLPGLHVTFVEFAQEFERILKKQQPLFRGEVVVATSLKKCTRRGDEVHLGRRPACVPV